MKTYSVDFLFEYHSTTYEPGQFQTARVVGENESLRDTAISVMREALKNGANLWTNEILEDVFIATYLVSDQVYDVKTGYEASGFGLKYALRPDGSIVVLEGYNPLGHDWTFRELHELADAAYIKGDPNKIILGLPIGLGAGGSGIPDMVSFMADVLSIGSFTLAGVRKITEGLKHTGIRRIAKRWKENNIDSPRQLREFLELKGAWRLAEVKKRLKLDDEFAMKLLTSLGMEIDGDLWKPGYSAKAIKKRKKWLELEKKYEERVYLS